MKSQPLVLCAALALFALSATARDVNGTVTAIKGQRVTLTTGDRPVTVSMPAGTQIKVGDVVTVSVELVGDALIARNVVTRRQ